MDIILATNPAHVNSMSRHPFYQQIRLPVNIKRFVLKHLMQHGHHVKGGDCLAKTIIFARNHNHAKFIEERFNHHYPRLEAGNFARVLDNKAKYTQSLIDDFGETKKTPHIAISNDMLDTGIDVRKVLKSCLVCQKHGGHGTSRCPISVCRLPQ